MGQKEIELRLPCTYSEQDLNRAAEQKLRLKHFSYKIIRKSLDSRRKDRIHWQIRLQIGSPELLPQAPLLSPRRIRSSRKVVIAGTGPAGIFAALFLQQSGIQVCLLERGKAVDQREKDIINLEEKGLFTPDSNYSFGEGGAGTFSDGKLTSRSKHIKREKQYILDEFVRHGAPEEILYLTHPHIGSDNLKIIARNMRQSFIEAGGDIRFQTSLTGLEIKDRRVRAVLTDHESLECDYAFLATGHSSYDTYRMLLNKGILFRPKNFALGFRMEHSQEQINRIQWGQPSLPGIKAAEYRLTSQEGDLPVYTFCMCPGGKIVPAAAYKDLNIVNGMSYYQRDGEFANAALVAGLSLDELTGRSNTAEDSLNWLEALEKDFFTTAPDYQAPAMTIGDFLKGKAESSLYPSSYERGLIPSDLTKLMPAAIVDSLRSGLKDICRRMPGFESGQLIGLESKTSAPIQVLRNRESSLATDWKNLFICGEASGYAGGIVSSASDGLRAALSLLSSL
ncbi:MAG: hypothetical protein B6241_12850 [Spirochaetaceae bacterium 4572_59]|nr:MAG: hypothetical protein B6241_12850 [Spirochaetaceae bacterium 4572_59]